MRPQTQYTKSGDISIAYQIVGDGPVDLVLVPGFASHLELDWKEPRLGCIAAKTSTPAPRRAAQSRSGSRGARSEAALRSSGLTE